MKGAIAIATAVFLTVSYLPSSAEAQRKPVRPRTSARVAPKQPEHSPAEVLLANLYMNSVAEDDTDLAKACASSSAKGLIYSLDKVVTDWDYEKGEFESSSDYAARMAKLEKTVNIERRAIVCKALSDDGSGVRYNADRQQFTASSYGITHVDSYSKDTGSYTSTTRMGVKAKVYAGVRIDYELDFGPTSTYDLTKTLGCQNGLISSDLVFAVPSTKAPVVKIGGYLVLLGHLRQPFVSKVERSGSPTLDDPFDTTVLTYTLKFTPEEALLVGPDGERFACNGRTPAQQ